MDYKDLGLGNKYKETGRLLKKTSKNIKKQKWLKRVLIIAGIVIGAYIVNMIANIEHTRPDEKILYFMPEGKKIEIELDETLDPDTDGLTTKEELELGTNPFNRDTDGDGVTDGGEVRLGLNPKEADENILEDVYKGIVRLGHDVPVNYENFELRADDLHSRAYMSIISEKLPNEQIKTTISNFKGTVNTDSLKKQKDGLHRKDGKVNGEAEYISAGDTITTLRVFGNDNLIENSFLRGLLKFILPEKGAICAFDNLKSDYSPVVLKYNNKQINKLTELPENRFNLLHIDTSFKDKLSDRLRLGEVVPASIISNDKEYIIYITGQFEDGNFAVSDGDREIGVLYLKKVSRPITDGDNFVQMQSLSFELGELSSEKGDRLLFL